MLPLCQELCGMIDIIYVTWLLSTYYVTGMGEKPCFLGRAGNEQGNTQYVRYRQMLRSMKVAARER